MAGIQDHNHHIMEKGSEYMKWACSLWTGVRRIVLLLCLYIIVLLAEFYRHFLLLVKKTQKTGTPSVGEP